MIRLWRLAPGGSSRCAVERLSIRPKMEASKTGDGLPRTFLKALLHPWTWRMAWRDCRTQRQRLAIFSLAMVAGVSALVATHSLKATMQSGSATQAKSLLGSDMQVCSRQPITETAIREAKIPAKRLSRE